ncbi:hypothetical protein WUBG_16762 [Wuchereria bancrofti]|uniref:Uncharacterized protein n=1 Tax=Wuchereria bancrofti TaxID=6293 RepID=J9EAB3_WUCBA|nr:hypothetical protein WUBG_16762 [Wuchereria bancrofti]
MVQLQSQSAPSYSLGPFNEIERKGSVVVQASDVNLIWAALSVYGRFFGKPIALHFNSVDRKVSERQSP